MGIIISENLVECVKMSEENSEDSQALINEAVELLIKVNDKYNHHIVMLVIGILGGFISGLVGIGSNCYLPGSLIITTIIWFTYL